MSEPKNVEELLKAALAQKLVENGGTDLGTLTATVDPTALLGPTSPVTHVIDTVTTADPPPPPPPSGHGPTTGIRYTNITAFTKSKTGTTIVWSARDSQQDNVTVYATSVKYKPTQADNWTATPPAQQRIIGIRKVVRDQHPWGVDGFHWWYGIDTHDETGQPEVYASDSDTEPDDRATWIAAVEFEEQLAAITRRRQERVELLAAVDSGLSGALRAARADAIAAMKRSMAYDKHGDDRWYLPSRVTVGGLLRALVERGALPDWADTPSNPDPELGGIEYIRFQAESALRESLLGYVTQDVGAKLKRVAEQGYATPDDILGPKGPLTRSQMLDGFLAGDAIPTARNIFDTTVRRAPLFAELERIAETPFEPDAGRRFRDDGRNPWNTILTGGFRHRTIDQSPATVIAALRRVASTMGISTWAHVYHQSNNGNGVPTISTAVQPAGSGASNAGWQYAIDLPDLAHVYPAHELTTTILGGPNIAGGQNDNTELRMNAPLLADATIIAISGGPMNEFTFLTAVDPAWIVGFRRLSVQGELAWRASFEQKWRAVADAPAIKQALEAVNEFTFPE